MDTHTKSVGRLPFGLGLAAWTLAIGFLFPATPEAARVRSIAIDTMTQRAGTIFSGRCIDAREVHDKGAGRPVTEFTFAVLRGVKGLEARKQITVRMLAPGSLAGFPDGPGGGIRAGDEVVLFLYPESTLGLTSPVGLGQGRFAILSDAKGGKVAVNPWGNRTLLKGIAKDALSRMSPEAQLELESGRVRPQTLLDVAQTLSRHAAPRRREAGR